MSLVQLGILAAIIGTVCTAVAVLLQYRADTRKRQAEEQADRARIRDDGIREGHRMRDEEVRQLTDERDQARRQATTWESRYIDIRDRERP